MKECGLCLSCGRFPSVDGITLCKFCREECRLYNERISRQVGYGELKKRQRRERVGRRSSDGVCVECGSSKVCNKVNYVTGKRNKYILCLKHYLGYLSRSVFGTRTRWRELLELYDRQDGKCYFSGRSIRIGYNAHLDHIEPACRNGRVTSLENLRWVYAEVNLMKSKKNEEEWLSLVADVARAKLGMS